MLAMQACSQCQADHRSFYAQVTQQEAASPLQVAKKGPIQAAVLAWLAQYSSLQAYQQPVTLLLKEYLPGTHGVALNEVNPAA